MRNKKVPRLKNWTLEKLQHETLRLIRDVKKQLYRLPHEEGLSDQEFVDQVLEPLKTRIEQDQNVIKLMDSNG